MVETKSINGSKGWSILFASVAASLMGSGSGVYVYMQNIGPKQLQEVARPDPATGTEMRRVESTLTRHLNFHPDMTNRFDRRITILETQLSIVLRNQERILDELDNGE